MVHPLASELSSVFNSARCSASIRPLTVKITSPFVALVILSIFAALCSDVLCPLSQSYGDRSSNCKRFNLNVLAVCEMSGSSSIAEIPYSRFQDDCGAAPLHLGLFLPANISTNMHVKTAIFEDQCSSGFPNPESRSIAGDFY
jgi:hypothetical protein